MRTTPVILLRFHTVECPDTFLRRVEAQAIDPETDLPIVSMSLQMMHAWLMKHGYRWRTASSGIWDRIGRAA